MDTTLTVFISSKMQELAAERALIHDLVTSLSSDLIKLKPWAYERDAPAADYPTVKVYSEVLEESRLYIGIFKKLYGEYTIDEYNKATEWGIERHLYIEAMPDEERDPLLAEFLGRVGHVETGRALCWFTDETDLHEKVRHSIKLWIHKRLTRTASTSALFATDPDDILHQPLKLIGRESLQNKIWSLIEEGQRILLHGFGGIGKTALAAAVAAEWIKNGRGSVLWLELGNQHPDAIFEALARPFGATRRIAGTYGDAQLKEVRFLLRERGVKLLVLDNAWDGSVLKTVLGSVPNGLPVLVTSRHAYPIGMRLDVDELAPQKAVETVAFYAGNLALINDPATAELCQLLGHLAFALEIAGKQIQSFKLTPAALHQRIQVAPHDMKMPLEFADAGRQSVADLLETSIEALDDEEVRKVFLAFGAFFAPQLTPLMLKLYELGRPQVVNSNTVLLPYLLFGIDTTSIENALNTLMTHGLVERVEATQDSMAAYRIHDLAYSYLRTQVDDERRSNALEVGLTYTYLHIEPLPKSFAALQPELENLMGAALWAFTNGYDTAVEKFALNLFAVGHFLDYRGLYSQAITLVSSALIAAERQGSLSDKGAHLSNLGSAYGLLGEYRKAIEHFEQALEIARQIGDKQGESTRLGNLGGAYGLLGEYRKAIGYHEQALEIAQQSEDKRGEGIHLSNLGRVYRYLGEYEKAIEHFEQALEIARQIGDKQGESTRLGNLGSAYGLSGEYRKAIEHFEQALEIARQIEDKQGESTQLGNLGNAYRDLGEYKKAIEHFEQALEIAQQIEDKQGEGAQLGNLGSVYGVLGEYRKAIEHFEQALEIAQQIEDKQGEGTQLGNLGSAYRDLGEYKKAIEHFEQALEIAQQIEDKQGEGTQLGNLGNAYGLLGEYKKAIEYHEQALEMARQIGDKRGEGVQLGNLGSVYQDLGEYKKAIEYHEQALEIAQQIEDKQGEGAHLGNLGNAYRDLGEHKKAIEYHEQALEIAQQIGDKLRENTHLGNLGSVYQNLGEYEKAIEYHEQGLEIARQIKDKQGEATHLGNLGNAYVLLGENRQAIEYYQQAQAIFVGIGVQHLVEQIERLIARAQAKINQAGGDEPPAE